MPLPFIGAFGLLILTGKTLNIFSFIGVIHLMGLVKKNAILLVDYTNTLRERGMARKEAILQAGPDEAETDSDDDRCHGLWNASRGSGAWRRG